MTPVARFASRPWTPLVTGAFFALATVICAVAGLSLLIPGGVSGAIWRIKPAVHAQLAHNPAAGAGFLALAGFMAAASWGCFRRRRWAWRLAIGIFAIDALGDASQALADKAEGLIGVAMAIAVIWWLTRARVRVLFE